MLSNYQGFKNFIKNFKDDGTIPKIIYRTSPFKFENIPQVILDSYKKDLEISEGFSMFYFDDFDCQCFIEENYGMEYLSLYNKLIPTAFKADLFRYLLLYKHGGVWMDFSMSLNTPLNKIIADFKQIYVRDRIHLLHGNWMNKVAIYQGFLCTIKDTDVLRITIERCLKNIKDRNFTQSCLAVTGTILLGMVYRELGIDGTNAFGADTQSTKIGYINKSIYVYAYEYEHDNVILDNDIPIINIKHPDHYNLIYKNRDHYGELWNQKKVFI
jgi:mannosyltransferase OCH1-like enzyme